MKPGSYILIYSMILLLTKDNTNCQLKQQEIEKKYMQPFDFECFLTTTCHFDVANFFRFKQNSLISNY
jgi:hypothetical protein